MPVSTAVASSVRSQINKAINARLKSKLKVRVDHLPEAMRAQQNGVLTFFFDSCRSEEPDELNYESEGFTQKQTLYYRCNISVSSPNGDDKTAAIVDAVHKALLGYRPIVPNPSYANEGYIFAVSDEVVELEGGILYHSIVVALNYYLQVSPVDD